MSSNFGEINNIYSKWDYTEKYKEIKLWADSLGRDIASDDCLKSIYGSETWLDDVKRKMRAYTHRDVKNDVCVCYCSDGSEYLHRVRVPDGINTKEEARAWFYDEMYIEYIPSWYDCTGQHFNKLDHIGRLNGSLWVWVWECWDV